MNRLLKILTLGLEKKRAWQLPIIAGLLVLFGLGVRWWFNSRAAKGIRLLDMVDIGDIDGARWICRWDRKQVNKEGEVTRARREWGKLLDTGKYYPLFLAVKKDYTRIGRVLIRAGAEVNARNNYGDTPLHKAAWEGRTELVKSLLEAGAKVNAGDRDGETPLHWAASKRETQVAKILIEGGAEVNAKDEDSETPLHFAAHLGHNKKTIMVLIAAGAEVNARNKCGWTPLHWAAYGGCSETAKVLLKAGAELKVRTTSGMWIGQTPLHKAALKGNPEAVKVLLEAGAKINAKDKDGRTPLDMTKQRKDWADPKRQAKCAELLREHGGKTSAELDAETKQGNPQR